MTCAVIFGGAGFIGSFFARTLAESGRFKTIYLADHLIDKQDPSLFRARFIAETPGAVGISVDVRQPIIFLPTEPVGLIANFAAVHREPGHEPEEYFETNLKGAENICAWAEQMQCRDLIFTSSISPYGVSETVKDESTLPVPITPYGGSKLVAEKIHLAWQAADREARRLLIVRPGVVFGPGEGGNVSRLIKAVLGGYFVYTGNKNTRKAGIYVKELCAAIWWMYNRAETRCGGVELFNGSMNPGPSISEYVSAVCEVAAVKRRVPNMPYALLMTIAYLADVVARPLNIQHPFSPVRVRKLVRSNNILPKVLTESGYRYKYTLQSAFADWRNTCPSEWGLDLPGVAGAVKAPGTRG